MSTKIKMAHRRFHKGERVYVCDYTNPENIGYGTLIAVKDTNKPFVIYGDSVAIIALERENGQIAYVNVPGYMVYKIAPRISKEIGETVCYEHCATMACYEFYMPGNDENYYRFELYKGMPTKLA